MKNIFSCLFALFLLVSAFTLSGQQINSVTHVPNPAYAGNSVSLDMNIRLWPHYDLMGEYIAWAGSNVYIYLDFDYNPPTPWMPGIAADIDYTVVLGTLGAGTYTARILDFDNGTTLYTYSFSVLNNCAPPTLSQLAVSNLGCTSATLQCNAGGVSAYGYRYRPVNSSTWTTVSSTPYNYLNITNLQSNTHYVFQARVWCSGTASAWSADKYFLTCQSGGAGTCANPYNAYCGNTYTGTNAAGTNNYNSYGTLFTQMYGPEVFYQLTLTQPGPLTLSLTGLAYNQDLDLIVLSGCNANAIVAYSGNSGNNSEYINVGYLAAGTYRIVIDGWNYSASNYVLTVQCNTFTCQPPAPSQMYASNITAYTARIHCNYTGASGFDWRYRKSGTITWLDLPGGSASYYNLSGLSASTMYEFQSSVFCNGAWTPWSASQYFTTSGAGISTPVNDEHCNAVTLSAGSGCNPVAGTNIGATTSLYPNLPTECNNTNMRDVWYRVQTPSTGKVMVSTFPGTMTDAVIALYFGSCNSLSPGVPNYCFDWNPSNGDEMPDVTLTSPPGTWWYIRVWGYGGTTGTFSICAQAVNSLTEDENTVGTGGDSEDRGSNADLGTLTDNAPANEPQKLALSPSPAREFVQCAVELEADAELDIRVFDLGGRPVLQREGIGATAGAFSERLDIAGLPAGLYIVRMSDGTREWTGKLVIE